MSRHDQPRLFAPPAVADGYCLDCEADTHDEYYMVEDSVWEDEAGMGDGMLCIGCLEVRIGRTLRPEDFPDRPVNLPSREDSPRIRDRKGRGGSRLWRGEVWDEAEERMVAFVEAMDALASLGFTPGHIASRAAEFADWRGRPSALIAPPSPRDDAPAQEVGDA